jgi:hypothetical protein
LRLRVARADRRPRSTQERIAPPPRTLPCHWIPAPATLGRCPTLRRPMRDETHRRLSTGARLPSRSFAAAADARVT